MTKIERKKFKGQNSSSHEAVGFLPSAHAVGGVGCSMQGIMMRCLLLVIFLLCFVPNPSSAALPNIETLSSIRDHLALPSGVAVSGDETIYIAESNNNLVHLFNRSGQHQGAISGLDGPTAVAVDSAGRIYIGNTRKDKGKSKNYVEVYDANLSSIGKLGSGDGEFKTPVGIAIGSAGLIYVVDRREHQVKIYNADHSFRLAFGGEGTADGQFQSPTSIVINEATSEILIPDLTLSAGAARVQVFDLNGVFLRSFTTTGSDKFGETVNFVSPSGIAVDGLDRIYVTDSQENVVTVYGTQGNYLGQFNGSAQTLRAPQGIAFAPGSSRLFVASQNTNTVETFGIDSAYGRIAVSPQSYRFTDVAINGASTSQRFDLSNDGSGDLAVGAITLTGANASEFSIVSNDCVDATLGTAAQCAIDVQFKPTSEGGKNASLSIASDDIYLPTLKVALSGNLDSQHAGLIPTDEGVGTGGLNVAPPATYSITVEAGANGRISPAGSVTADAGSTEVFNITADTGYRISDVRVDGVSVGVISSHSFKDIGADHRIAADFVTADSFSLASIEMGEVSVGHEWKRVNLRNKFTDPIVVIKPASLNDASSAVVRVRNVDAQGFDVRIQEWGYLEYLDGESPEHAEEQVGYVVMEKGVHALKDGTQIEAGQFDTNAASSFETVNFAQSFAVTPVVMSSVVTSNNDKAVIGRVSNVDVTSFGYVLQEQQINSEPHGVEKVSFIAWEPSQYSQDGISFEVGIESSVETEQTVAVRFGGSYLSQPLLIAGLQTANTTADDPLAVNLRWSNKSTIGVDILLDQEDSPNAFNRLLERPESVLASSIETLGYLVLLPVSHTLAVEKSGSGSGQILVQGINCGEKCSENYSNGTLVTLSAVAADGSVFTGWSGGDCSGTDDCVVTVRQAMTVTANFTTVPPTTYSITASAGTDGSISPAGMVSADAGAAATFDITANAGYHILEVLVDGVPIGAKDSYSFSNLGADHTITATFAADVATAGLLKLSSVEMGEVTVGDEWKQVELHKTFVNPVVVIKPASRNDVSPAVVRVRNVDDQGFEVRIQEWRYLLNSGNSVVHAEEQVGYIVMEKGSYTLESGARVEAGQFNAGAASAKFAQAFSASPVVLASIVTSNNDDTPVIVQMSNVSATGFDYKLQEEALNNHILKAETASFIAWEPSKGLQDGVSFVAGFVDNAVPQEVTAIEYSNTQVPPWFIADLQTTNGGVVNLRLVDKSATEASLLIDQEQSLQGSVSVSSSSEIIGYLMLSRLDTDCDGLSDESEIKTYRTDPQKADTDGDGMIDGKEVYYWLGNWGGDIDGDGLINLLDMDSAGNGTRDGSLEPVGDGTPTDIGDVCNGDELITDLRNGTSGTGRTPRDTFSRLNKMRAGRDREKAVFNRDALKNMGKQQKSFDQRQQGFSRKPLSVDAPPRFER